MIARPDKTVPHYVMGDAAGRVGDDLRVGNGCRSAATGRPAFMQLLHDLVNAARADPFLRLRSDIAAVEVVTETPARSRRTADVLWTPAQRQRAADLPAAPVKHSSGAMTARTAPRH